MFELVDIHLKLNPENYFFTVFKLLGAIVFLFIQQ